MTRRCDSNPAQYERNRRFGHLVHALARAGGGAKLPSVGLCLNASKAVSCLVKGGNDTFLSFYESKGSKQCDFTRHQTFSSGVARAKVAVGADGRRRDRFLPRLTWPFDGRSWVNYFDVEALNCL